MGWPKNKSANENAGSSIRKSAWRHPFQWPMSIIKQIKLKIRTAATKIIYWNVVLTKGEIIFGTVPRKNMTETWPVNYRSFTVIVSEDCQKNQRSVDNNI